MNERTLRSVSIQAILIGVGLAGIIISFHVNDILYELQLPFGAENGWARAELAFYSFKAVYIFAGGTVAVGIGAFMLIRGIVKRRKVAVEPGTTSTLVVAGSVTALSIGLMATAYSVFMSQLFFLLRVQLAIDSSTARLAIAARAEHVPLLLLAGMFVTLVSVLVLLRVYPGRKPA